MNRRVDELSDEERQQLWDRALIGGPVFILLGFALEGYLPFLDAFFLASVLLGQYMWRSSMVSNMALLAAGLLIAKALVFSS